MKTLLLLLAMQTRIGIDQINWPMPVVMNRKVCTQVTQTASCVGLELLTIKFVDGTTRTVVAIEATQELIDNPVWQ